MKEDFIQAIEALKSGNKILSRQLLIAIIKNDPRHVQAWYALSFLVDKREQKIDCLRRVLSYVPHYEKAHIRLHDLETDVAQDEQNNEHDPTLSVPAIIVAKLDPSNNAVFLNNIRQEEQVSPVSDTNLIRPTTENRQPSSKNLFAKTHSYARCLWQLTDKEVNSRYDEPDVLQFLIDDIARLPIITNPHQELWLGIQLQAGNRLNSVCQAWKSPYVKTAFAQFLCSTLLSCWTSLEQTCLEQNLQPPKLEIWVSELLAVYRNVYAMHRSRLLRFIRRVKAVMPEDVGESALQLIYQIVETLSVFPTTTLTQLTAFVATYQQLPTDEEMALWLPVEFSELEQQVVMRIKQTQQMLTVGYLRYAMRIAQGYVGQGVDYADLVQAGFIGLWRAANKFDYRIQARFGTYATSWIWQAVGREIADQGRIIRLPVHVQEDLRKWQLACEQYDDGQHDPVLNLQVLLHAGLLEQRDFDMLRNAKHTNGTLPAPVVARYEGAIAKAHKLCANSVAVFSLAEIGISATSDEFVDEAESLNELLLDPNLSVDEAADVPFVRQLIEEQIFVFLTDREREVLTLRCGWEDGQERTLEEVGAHYGLTRERIRQIEAKAHKKLQNRLALGLLPAIHELIPEEKPLFNLQPGTQIVLPLIKTPVVQHSSETDRLNSLLSQLPRSDWIQGRTGIQGGQRREELVAAMESLASPAHVSDIAEQLNGAITGKELDDSHVYALLLRDEATFVLLGQSIFSLVNWERARTTERWPVLPCCPMPLPDPPDYEDAFFESVLVGRQALQRGLTAVQFIHYMLNWAKVETEPQKWFLQTILSSYYLVGLVPYIFYFGGDNPVISCTLPTADIQDLRYHCLEKLTERLVAMPEFWWLLQQHQPVRPTDLGELFADIHPYGLDDVLQRLRLLASLGAAQKLRYGEYRLTSLGEECANWWKREVVVETAVAYDPNPLHDFADFIEW